MARNEVCGGTAAEIEQLREDYQGTPLQENHGIPFETAYCLIEIPHQPDDYDGPQRYCKRRATRKSEYDEKYSEDAYAAVCRFHGSGPVVSPDGEHLPDEPATIPIKHGLHAKDENLKMDFNEDEQTLYDGIMSAWPAAYGWPEREDDPARYEILDMVATNVVRRHRCEDYIDEDGEVHLEPVFEDGIEVGEKETENPIAREYRLLVDEIISMLKELGLTPKERQRMDTMEAEEGSHDALADVAQEALGGDGDYDPSEFEDG